MIPRYVLRHKMSFVRANMFLPQEATNATITLEEYDPAIVNRMIIYLYTNDYPDGKIPDEQQPLTTTDSFISPYMLSLGSPVSVTAEMTTADRLMMVNILVFSMADRYELRPLKTVAKDKICACMQTSAAYANPEIVRMAFEVLPTEDMGIKDIVIKACADHIEEILSDPAMEGLLTTIAPLSFGIITQMYGRDKQASEQVLEKALAREAFLVTDHDKTKSALADALDREALERNKKNAATEDDQTILKGSRKKQAEVTHAIGAQQKAIEQKDFAIKQRDSVIQERDVAIKQASHHLEWVDYSLKRSYDWKGCRNCGLEFNSYVERFGDNDVVRLRLRCSDCSCRHGLEAGLGERFGGS